LNRSLRSYFAPASVILLIVAAGFAFVNLQGTSIAPSPILDPDFQLWTGTGNSTQLMVWNLESHTPAGTQFSIKKTTIQNRDALGLNVYQSGTVSDWAYIRLSETLDGSRLMALMNATIGLWVFKEPCHCDADPFADNSVVLAVETNDGVHMVSFIFTDQLSGAVTLLDHRIVFIPTPSGQWSFEEVNIAREYANENWSTPEALTFSLVFGVAGNAEGWHRAYLNQISIQSSLVQSSSLAQTEVAVQRIGNLTKFYQMFKVDRIQAIGD